ncbi:MAG: haloacid dehalogenase type II [Chloroflexota bacterium]
MPTPDVKALVCDVFGTVVNWRDSVIREGTALGAKHGLTLDWGAFVDEWRTQGYSGAIRTVLRGEAPWRRVDELHLTKLESMLAERNITLPREDVVHFSRVWHRLDPWPDSVPGLNRIKSRYIISPLSNGDFSLLINMAKFGGLPWDCILTSELAESYKPDPRVYALAPRYLDLKPEQILMTAAHVNDLRSAKAEGLRTAMILRPHEWGPVVGSKEPPPDPDFDYVAAGFEDLASQLGT